MKSNKSIKKRVLRTPLLWGARPSRLDKVVALAELGLIFQCHREGWPLGGSCLADGQFVVFRVVSGPGISVK
jgi:hypothetical protein